tara:strand:+ start:6314 stop:6550 length:237 start_codon:yes stop_codon:yes gene_type:complete
VASGQDKSGSDSEERCDEGADILELPALSPRAREIKRQIQEGTYRVDLPALADRLLDTLDEPSPSTATPQNDQEPRDE